MRIVFLLRFSFFVIKQCCNRIQLKQQPKKSSGDIVTMRGIVPVKEELSNIFSGLLQKLRFCKFWNLKYLSIGKVFVFRNYEKNWNQWRNVQFQGESLSVFPWYLLFCFLVFFSRNHRYSIFIRHMNSPRKGHVEDQRTLTRVSLSPKSVRRDTYTVASPTHYWGNLTKAQEWKSYMRPQLQQSHRTLLSRFD